MSETLEFRISTCTFGGDTTGPIIRGFRRQVGGEVRGTGRAQILLGLCMDGAHLDYIWRPR